MGTVDIALLVMLGAMALGNAAVLARVAWREQRPELGLLGVTGFNSVVVMVGLGFQWDSYQAIFLVPVLLMVVAGLNLMAAVRLGLTLLEDE
ncbi:MAG: hypothetical protein HY904_23245 [Deltaproteobacteria bacterium]|nr:hypothetical protein [Deltaproteobacteria bacterium]